MWEKMCIEMRNLTDAVHSAHFNRHTLTTRCMMNACARLPCTHSLVLSPPITPRLPPPPQAHAGGYFFLVFLTDTLQAYHKVISKQGFPQLIPLLLLVQKNCPHPTAGEARCWFGCKFQSIAMGRRAQPGENTAKKGECRECKAVCLPTSLLPNSPISTPPSPKHPFTFPTTTPFHWIVV